jgi:hypothetical protein
MNCAMEMHDSFVLEVCRLDGGAGYVLFNAVVTNPTEFQAAMQGLADGSVFA